MVVRYRSSLLSRVERAEFNYKQMKSNTILLIDMDENGLNKTLKTKESI